MTISNFHFLRQHYPKLAELGEQAEEYAYSDPQTSVFKLRLFSEMVVELLYQRLQLENLVNNDQFNRLKNKQFCLAIPLDIQSKLHTV